MQSYLARLVNVFILCALFAVAWHYVHQQLLVVQSAGDAIRSAVSQQPHYVTDNAQELNEIGIASSKDAGEADDADELGLRGAHPDEPAQVPAGHAPSASEPGRIQAFVEDKVAPQLRKLSGGLTAAPHVNQGDTLQFPHSALVCSSEDTLNQAVRAMEARQLAVVKASLRSHDPAHGDCEMVLTTKTFRVLSVRYRPVHPSIATMNIVDANDDSAQPEWALNIGAQVGHF